MGFVVSAAIPTFAKRKDSWVRRSDHGYLKNRLPQHFSPLSLKGEAPLMDQDLYDRLHPPRNEFEGLCRKNPVLWNWFYFFANQHRVIHWRYRNEAMNTLIGFGFYETFLATGNERRRIPPYLVDGVLVFGTLLLRNALVAPSHDLSTVWGGAWQAATVTGVMLCFRVIAFIFYTYIHALCNLAPAYDKRLRPLMYFPGIPFRLLFFFDIVIPQSLFIGVFYGWQIGWLVFGVSMAQYVYRVFQDHGVYPPLRARMDFAALCLMIASLVLYWLFGK